MNSAIKPYIALAFGILALGFSAFFVRWADAPGAVTAFYRMALATAALLPVYAVQRSGKLLPSRAWVWLPLLGGALTAFDLFCWNTALQYTRVANAVLLGNTAPLWVALFAAWVWREPLSKRFWFGLMLALSGAALVLSWDFILHPTLGWGDLLAVTAGVFYAGYYLVTQKSRQTLDTLTYMWWMNLGSALCLLLMTQALRMPLTGYDSQTWLAFGGAALISQAFGYLVIGYALGHLPASVVAPTMVGQPVLTALLAIPLMGEFLSPVQWIGGAAVLTGIVLVHQHRARAQKLALLEA